MADTIPNRVFYLADDAQGGAEPLSQPWHCPTRSLARSGSRSRIRRSWHAGTRRWSRLVRRVRRSWRRRGQQDSPELTRGWPR